MMTWANKSVLVTGAGGFIGSHLAERLVRLGARVRAAVRYNSHNDWGWLEVLPEEIKSNLDIRAGDLVDPFWTLQVAEGCDVIFHLAALIAIPYSYTSPHQFATVNCTGVLNLLEAARRLGVERFVHTSTSETYGTALYTPIDEKHPLRAQSPYAASKIAADKLVESYHLSYGLPAAIIRPFNTYGPRQSARAVIPTIISQGLARDTIRLGLLTPRRDLTFVQDTVTAFIKMAETPAAVGEVINVGSGTALAIGDLADRLIALLGGNKRVVADEARVRPPASEVMELLSDNRKAQSVLGWRPAVTLEAGLQETIKFIRDHRERYKPEMYNL
ncbi:MAG: GDP-mannose 4,6-dehydratase [Desulfobaccales bacterium]